MSEPRLHHYVEGCTCGGCRRIAEAARTERLQRDHDAMRDTLTRAQARCTELLEEARLLRVPRDERQARTFEWAVRTFGLANADQVERACRLLEEALELAQAAGLGEHMATLLLRHVYARPPGDPAQEAGGVGLTLMAYCASAGLSAEGCEAAELARVLSRDPAEMRARHDAKAAAGLAEPTGG